MLKFILFMFISIYVRFFYLYFHFIYVEITLLGYFLKQCEEWYVRY